MIYPKDGAAGGSWIALKENGDAAVLLNGAFIRHHSMPPYRKSRGLLFLEVLATSRPAWTFSRTDLRGMEPFTLIVYSQRSLYEFRWDGHERYCKQLPVNRPHIWSSSTLYDGLTAKKREQWFASFLNNHPNPTQRDITRFHREAGEGKPEEGLVMRREEGYATVSITSLLITGDRGVMEYHDLLEETSSSIRIELLNAVETI
jgi:hypothetical protein